MNKTQQPVPGPTSQYEQSLAYVGRFLKWMTREHQDLVAPAAPVALYRTQVAACHVHIELVRGDLRDVPGH